MTQEEDEKMQLEYIEAYFDKRRPMLEGKRRHQTTLDA